jgi:hypothetical protein
MRKKQCQLNEHVCLDVLTRNWSCLPLNQAGDKHVDCIGGIDEQYNNSCTKEKSKHFQCYNTEKCISSDKLCDGFGDCEFRDDEEAICPWVSNSSKCILAKKFHCEDNLCLPRGHQCNKVIECKGGEDEWFCRYDQNKMFNKNSLVPFRSRRSLLGPAAVNYSWFCNFGLPVYSIDESTIKKCLCPASFYGERCQYQSNRLMLIYRIDVPQYLDNQMIKFVFYLYNINTTQIIDYDEIVHVTVRITFQPKKYIIYLIYPREGISVMF